MSDSLLKELPELREPPELIVVRGEDGSNARSASSRIVQLIWQESTSSGQSPNFLLNRLADSLYYLLLRDHVNDDNGVFAALIHPKLSVDLQQIHADSKRKWSVDELAGATGKSRSAFSGLFKDVVGLLSMNYVTQ